MSKGGRKGRVSNELVAASCTAILTVYAAGYWRTRDEARRFETPAQERRPVRSAPAAPISIHAEPPVAAATPSKPSSVPLARSEPQAATRKSSQVATAPSIPPVSMPAIATLSEPQPEPQPEATVAPAAPEAEFHAKVIWHDGTYTGWGLSRHGDIEARVTIRNGGIVAVGIATCATRYPCYVIDEILQQPLFRQSPDVDRVSRATESADAYSDAVWQALQKAEAEPEATAVPSP